MVEELLQLFITKIDANLFECVKLEDFESGDVEDTNEGDLLHRRIDKSAVTHIYDITEETAVDVLDDGTDGDFAGVGVLGLTHPLSSDLRYTRRSILAYITKTNLVFGVNESVVDAFGAVAEVQDGVDLLTTIQRLGRGDLTHALKK